MLTPPDFIRLNDEDGEWLAALPELIERLAERWSLTVLAHFPDIRLNYVAPATRADSTACVLKLSRHIDETRTEIAALRLWNGHGAARLLEADAELGALLVERLRPGTMLSQVAETDDDAATVIAAAVLRQLWRPAPASHRLRGLESWCAAYDRNRDALDRGVDGFPAALFQRADALRARSAGFYRCAIGAAWRPAPLQRSARRSCRLAGHRPEGSGRRPLFRRLPVPAQPASGAAGASIAAAWTSSAPSWVSIGNGPAPGAWCMPCSTRAGTLKRAIRGNARWPMPNKRRRSNSGVTPGRCGGAV